MKISYSQLLTIDRVQMAIFNERHVQAGYRLTSFELFCGIAQGYSL